MRQRHGRPLLDYFHGEVSAQRSQAMGRIGHRDTLPERMLRSQLTRMGVRYRVHGKDIPGTPDIYHKSARVVVFVDGCFWHGCPRHFKVPKTRSEFWMEKIHRNKLSRIRVLGALADWTVVQFYECEIRKDANLCAAQVVARIRRGVPA